MMWNAMFPLVAATSSAELAWFLHRRWVSISFKGYFTYIQIISKDKRNYIIQTKMQVNNAYASIYVRILMAESST